MDKNNRLWSATQLDNMTSCIMRMMLSAGTPLFLSCFPELHCFRVTITQMLVDLKVYIIMLKNVTKMLPNHLAHNMCDVAYGKKNVVNRTVNGGTGKTAMLVIILFVIDK